MLFFLFTFLIDIFGFSHISNAANPSIFDVSFSLPCVGNTPCPNPSDLPGFILRLYRFGAGIAGILAVGMIVFGAIYRMLNPGSADKQKEGVDMITSAIWGLVLLFGSYLILKTVNPRLVILDLNPVGSVATITFDRPSYANHPCPDYCSDTIAFKFIVPGSCTKLENVYTPDGKTCWSCWYMGLYRRTERLTCNFGSGIPKTADPCSVECDETNRKYKDTQCQELTGAVSNKNGKQCYSCPIIVDGAPQNDYNNCYFK